MKNYYSILGIKETSSLEDIKKAYRGLSHKFHPDKNNGDGFFTEKFKEIQEAYETLRDASKRSKYDFERSVNFNSLRIDPTIEYFNCSKLEFDIYEEITFIWKTNGANIITLNPFGRVTAIGSKMVRFKYWKPEILSVELLIENTLTGKKCKSTITFDNRSYKEPQFKRIIEPESKAKGDTSFYGDIVKFVLTFLILRLINWLTT
jgi:curved DNA-binding protein CbpA